MTEDWITSLEEGDTVTLEVGECDPPIQVELGTTEFDVEGIDSIDVEVVDVAGWQTGPASSGAYIVTVEFCDEDVAEEMGAIATGGKLRWKGKMSTYDLELKVPAVQEKTAMSSADVEVFPGES